MHCVLKRFFFIGFEFRLSQIEGDRSAAATDAASEVIVALTQQMNFLLQ